MPKLELGESGQIRKRSLRYKSVGLTLIISFIANVGSGVPVTRAVSLHAHLQTFPP